MKTRESFLVLIEELEGNMRELDRARRRNDEAWERIQAGASSPIDWGALGFTLHNLYGILENYFLRVSKFFENNLDANRWHRALVEKMALDIPDIRPAVLSGERMKYPTIELLKFRHRLRNLYGEDLDPVKTAEIQRLATELVLGFKDQHSAFTRKIRSIAEAVR